MTDDRSLAGRRPIRGIDGDVVVVDDNTASSEIDIPVATGSKGADDDSPKRDANAVVVGGGVVDWYDDETAGSVPRDGEAENDDDDINDDINDDREGFALLRGSRGEGLPSADGEGADSSALSTLSAGRRQRRRSVLSRLWRGHWLGPDGGPWTVSSFVLLDEGAFRLAKFLIVTGICLVAVHGYVVAVGGKRDVTYDLSAMVAYDGKAIAADAIVFFVVARLHEAPAVDTLAETVPLLVTAIGQSWGHTHLRSLQHSITPYDIRCNWTWPMYLLNGICGSLLLALLVAHCREVARRGRTLRALLELAGTALVFAVPVVAAKEPRAFVHVHHWYWAWFLGMHCNLRGAWWSRLARSALWGIYVNGVAVFGRDPVLACAESLYRSRSQRCPYLDDGDGDGDGDAYTLEDLAEALHPVAAVAEAAASDAIACASDATRWLSPSLWW